MSQLIQITAKDGTPIEEKALDLEAVKAKLAQTNGQGYWQRLEELAETPGFNEMLKREFPLQAPKDWAPLPRREFVKLMGAALALAGLSGCAFQPPEKIVPYVKAPEEITPGIPLFYATAMPFMGYGLGLLAEANEGRPTKLEGNPDHPTSRGTTDLWAQAEILNLYDPDRSQTIRQAGASSDWDTFAGALASQIEALRPTQGQGFVLVTESVTSPTLQNLIAQAQEALPRMRWISYEPLNRDNVRQGVALAFGRDLHPVYHFDRADKIVSLDCDFLHEEPGHVAHAREFVSGRKLTQANGEIVAAETATMNRLYTFESTVTMTGSMADHRYPVKAAQIEAVARALAAELGVPGVSASQTALPENVQKAIPAIAADLRASRGRALVVAGAHHSSAVHAMAHAITAALGGAGATGPISYHAPFDGSNGDQLEEMLSLVRDMGAKTVRAVVFMNTNPAYTLPSDVKFKEALANVPFKAHYGAYDDETGVLCDWHVPAAHFLEYWGDVRAIDGTVSLIQPLVQPLYEAAKSPAEFLAAFTGQRGVSSYDIVRGRYLASRGGNDNKAFQVFWQEAVHNGFIPGTAAPAVGVSPRAISLPETATNASGLEVNFRPDPTLLDGRYANNGWLQECPKPNLQTVWDNAIIMSPNSAIGRGWKNNTEVTLRVGTRSVTGGLLVLPGQPDEVVTVHLGYGRRVVGKIGTGTGFDANAIRTSENLWFASGAKVEATGGVYKIASTNTYNIIAPQGKDTKWEKPLDGGKGWLHSDESKTKIINNILTPKTADLDIDGMHGRDMVRAATFAEFKEGILPTSEKDKKGLPLSYPQNPEKFRQVYVENHPNAKEKGEDKHAGGKSHSGDSHANDEHHEHFSWRKKPIQGDRELEGYPSFYPRDTDAQGLTPYKDPEVNRVEAERAAAEGRAHTSHQWGMSVDLHSCIGCNACVIACQSENNTAVVGKDQVLMGRSMHWMRIDTYYRGSYENPEVYYEPMMCQHCEKAPCEPVCPFNATMHSPEGISEQIYNRCVGTKYCENNCPYKVRKFNFLQYSDQQTPVIQLMHNPDVTVRSRGVMEKCSYCIQRVENAKWQADKEDRRVRDGEVVTACQQSCPTNAIHFGDINDPNSVVSKHKRGPMTFGLLMEFNNMPRTSYTARLKNPNPAIIAIDESQKPASLKKGADKVPFNEDGTPVDDSKAKHGGEAGH